MLYFPDEWWRSKVVSCYYKCLGENAFFRSELSVLFRELERDLETLDSICSWGESRLVVERWPYRPIDIDVPDYRAYNAVASKLSGFCERWHLPQDHGIGDLVWSCKLWRFTKEPMLMQGWKVFWLPDVGIPIDAGTVDFGDVSAKVTEHALSIFPNAPLPLIYDPLCTSREELNKRIDAICREIRESILAQAEVYERQVREAGFKPRPPRLTPQQIQRTARAIYRRAVFGWQWKEIYREYEGLSDDACIDTEKVRSFAELVRGWAEDCQIPLE